MRSVQCLPPLEDGSIVLKSGYCFVVSFVRVEDQIGRMGDPFVVKGIETCHCWALKHVTVGIVVSRAQQELGG